MSEDTMPTPATPVAVPAAVTAFSSIETLSKWLELLRKVTVSLAVVAATVIVVILVTREVYKEGLIIDPVVVQLADPKAGPSPELAAQQIAKNIDVIQHAGVREWNKLYVDQAPSPIDLHLPGAPFTLRTGLRELAGLFGRKRPTIVVSVASRKEPAGYIASITLAADRGVPALCEVADSTKAFDKIFECVAINAFAFIDPKVAASYVFSDEQHLCNKLDTGQQANIDVLEKEERRIKNRRERCSFARTQSLIAKALDLGRKEDLPWVSYVFGKVHLARAAALAGIDGAQQLSELDQAIGRFADAVNHRPDSATAVAYLIDAYLQKGIAIHEATGSLGWSEDSTSALQWRLYLAESTFADASSRLDKLQQSADANLRALAQQLEGALYYRQWMLMAHRRMKSGNVDVALGQPIELALLEQADQRFAAAASSGLLSANMFVNWGNVLRAAGKFEAAVEKYLRAADLEPGNYAPFLNTAVVYLDRVKYGPTPANPIHVLVALGASSDYLSWISDGGPYPQFTGAVERALSHTGEANDGEAFKSCLTPAASSSDAPADPEIDHWKAAAELKLCVDQTIDRINKRIMRVPRPTINTVSKAR